MRVQARFLLPLILGWLSLVQLAAAKEDPVQWTLSPADGVVAVAPGGKAWLALKATIQPGWHLYSPTTPPGGPIITQIRLSDNPAVSSYTLYRPQPVRKLDQNFGVDTETYSGEATFLFDAPTAASASGQARISAATRYQACSDVKCL